jgi:hypothetical protein
VAELASAADMFGQVVVYVFLLPVAFHYCDV